MNDFINRNRQEYIINGNQQNKPVDKEVFIQGNRQKVEIEH